MSKAAYKLLQLLGMGKDSEVWAASGPHGLVAVKRYPANKLPQARGEFDESRVLNHPGLLHPLDISMDGNRPLLVLPYCEGRSLDNIAGHLGEEMAWTLLLEVGQALEYVHAKGLYHGGVCPANLLWNGEHVMLSGLGGADDAIPFTAPESGKSAPADIWSLAACVFYLYMGSQVFNGLGGKAQKKESVIPTMRQELPELSQLIMRCLAFDPEERPSASQLVKEAAQGLEQARAKVYTRPAKPGPLPSLDDPFTAFWPEEMTDTL